MIRHLALKLLPLAIVTCVASAAADVASDQTVKLQVHLDDPQQSVEGWGLNPGYNRPDWGPEYHLANQALVHEPLFGLNNNFIRINLSAGVGIDEHNQLDPSTLQNRVNLLKLAARYGKTKWVASVWTPPARWKIPQVPFAKLDRNDETAAKYPASEYPTREAYLNPAHVEDFTTWYVDILKHLRDVEGIEPPVLVSPQNEPSWAARYDSCVYTNQPEVWRDVVVSLRRKLDDAGFEEVLLGAPESGHLKRVEIFLGENYSKLEEDDELREAIDVFSNHTYDDHHESWGNDAFYWPMMKKFIEASERFDKPMWQTEMSMLHDWPDMHSALFMTSHLNRTMAVDGYTHWFLWHAWNQTQDGKIKGDQLLNGTTTDLIKTRFYHVVKRLWDDVPAGEGFRVVRLTSDDPHFITTYSDAFPLGPSSPVKGKKDGRGMPARPVHAVGYAHDDGRLTTVLVNDREQDRTVELTGLPAGGYRMHVISDESNGQSGEPVAASDDGLLQLGSPARSVVILTRIVGD